MARGVRGSGTVVSGQPMTAEDIQVAEKRIEGKRAPLHEDDHPLPQGRVFKTDDGRKITQVGEFNKPLNYGDSQTLKRFAPIEPDYTGWIKMTNKEALLYQDLRLLIGHDGDKKLGLIETRKLEKIKQDAKQGLLSESQLEALEQLEGIK